MIDLIQRFASLQASGARVENGREIAMADLPPGGRVELRGSLDDPEFNNLRLECRWPVGSELGCAR